MTDWTPVLHHELPPEGQVVEAITPSGDTRDLIFEKGLWWLPDHSMYVYFIPTYWRAK